MKSCNMPGGILAILRIVDMSFHPYNSSEVGGILYNFIL